MLNLDLEREYLIENEYIRIQKENEYWQQWEDEFNKKKEAKITIQYEKYKLEQISPVAKEGVFS